MFEIQYNFYFYFYNGGIKCIFSTLFIRNLHRDENLKTKYFHTRIFKNAITYIIFYNLMYRSFVQSTIQICLFDNEIDHFAIIIVILLKTNLFYKEKYSGIHQNTSRSFA